MKSTNFSCRIQASAYIRTMDPNEPYRQQKYYADRKHVFKSAYSDDTQSSSETEISNSH